MPLSFIETVFYTLHGTISEPYRIPGVINAFAEGSACSQAYCALSLAYERLRERLGVIDEDEDVEIILQSYMRIEEEIAYYMYRYGALFGDCDGKNILIQQPEE